MQPRVWHRFYDEGVPPGLDFETLPLPAFLKRSAREYGDATALIFQNRRLTYRQLQEEVDRFAAALSGLGVTRGTRVAIQLPNLPQTVIAFYAVLSLGATVVMTNPLYVEAGDRAPVERRRLFGGCHDGFPVRPSHRRYPPTALCRALRDRLDSRLPALSAEPPGAAEVATGEAAAHRVGRGGSRRPLHASG